MPDLPELLDAFDRLVAAASEVAPAEAVEDAARVARRSRSRRGYLGRTVLVALAGGTGSGKSSLVNALAGEEVAPTGARRPTTDEPLAWIPADPEPGLVRLLDDLGISERVGHAGLPWLAVLDLPDTDSVDFTHRATVERLVPQVDAVVWVLDPEKYQDRELHRRHIEPLAAYAPQFLFVLNQVDRVPDGHVEELVEDLRGTLRREGVEQPRIIPTAADPPFGGPEGIDRLLGALEAMGDAKRVVTSKLLTDLDRAAAELVAAAGVEGGATGFGPRWEEVVSGAADHVAHDLVGPGALAEAARTGRAAGRSAVALLRSGRPPESVPIPVSPVQGRGAIAAVDRIGSFLEDLQDEVGGETAALVRQVAAEVDREVGESADAVAAGASIPLAGPPSWWRAMAWLRRVVAVAGLVAVVALVQRVVSGGDLVAPLMVAGGALLVLAGSSAAASTSGASWARSAMEDRRAEVAGGVRRELDRRLGRPLRQALRGRAAVSAAHAEYALLRETLGGREVSA